jgi:hypothetical protein
MYWVLDGVLRCACVRVHVHVRAMSVCSFVCSCSFVRVRAHGVRACMLPSVSACACLCVSIGLHLRARVCSERVCAPSHCTAGTCGINSSACAGVLRPRARGCGRCHRPGLFAGITWTSRTLKAGWAARYGHTSVIDAAGAIYVLGGSGGSTYFQDVWASTDGGARPDAVRGGRGVLEGGYSRGYSRGYPRGTMGTHRGDVRYQYSSARAARCGRACVVAVGATGWARARWP